MPWRYPQYCDVRPRLRRDSLPSRPGSLCVAALRAYLRMRSTLKAAQVDLLAPEE